MKEIYCIDYNKYRKFKNPKISYMFNKTLVLSIIGDDCGINDKEPFKEEESTEILEFLGLISTMHARATLQLL